MDQGWPSVLWSAVTLGVALMVLPVSAQKGPNRSLTEEKEVDQLKKRILQLEESLIMAKAEADLFQEKLTELELRNKALGLEALTADEKAMREKLIRVVGQLAQSEKRRIQLEEWLRNVIKAAEALNKAEQAERGAKRAEYEAAIRGAEEFLAGNPLGPLKPAKDLSSGQIVDIDRDVNVAVVNLGKKQGGRVGMPFRIVREDRVIGRCRIVEVRDYLSAALIDQLTKGETARVGDHLLLEAIK